MPPAKALPFSSPSWPWSASNWPSLTTSRDICRPVDGVSNKAKKGEKQDIDQDDLKFFENMFRSLETEMGQRFDQVGNRFDRVDARLDRMETRLDKIAAGSQ